MALIFSACDSSFNAGTEFSSGRQAFITKKYEAALPYFQKVADSNPGYVFESFNYRQSVWSYLGRSQYYTGRYTEARQSFERALAVSREEHLARIFSGLALLREGDESTGAKELQSGLKGLQDWLEYENARSAAQTIWDPRKEIRNEIAKNLINLAGPSIERQSLIENGEWIGWAMEEEIDKVRRDKTH